MTNPRPILAYEPPRPKQRRVHPILALIIAHLTASYFVGLCVAALAVWRERGMPSGKAAWAWWVATAPAQVPGAFVGQLMLVMSGRGPGERETAVWLAFFLVVFTVAFLVLIHRCKPAGGEVAS